VGGKERDEGREIEIGSRRQGAEGSKKREQGRVREGKKGR
jgi:hypothetical protein